MSVMSLFDLSSDVAVVTGAGRGIGEGIAHAFADAGAAVLCAARRTEEIERVAKDIRGAGGRAIAVTTDVTNEEAVEKLAEAAVGEFGSLDIWVNNAGGSPIQAPLLDLPRDEWDATLLLNLTAPWLCTKVASKYMGESGGRILHISSRAGSDPVPGSGHYSAAKAALNNMTISMARELGPRIRVNTIEPGAVPTEIMMQALKLKEEDLPALEKAIKLPAGRLGTPQDLGAAALYLCSPAGAWVTGVILPVSGGM